MSWIEKLCKTYENNLDNIANPNDAVPLLPLYHSSQSAQIHVVIDGEGKFLRASIVSKEEAQTIIPSTEESAGRSGATIAPHPLCDTLQYVAGDYQSWGGNPQKKQNESGFKPYIDGLHGWVEWSNDRKLRALFAYLSKGHLIQDLVKHSVLVGDSKGQLVASWSGPKEEPPIFKTIKQAKKKGQYEAFIRFSVEIPGDPQSELWNDAALRDSWSKFYSTFQKNTDVCMVTGQKLHIASNHPKYIRYPGDGAKLVSSNDTEGFTYLGRFTSDKQACSIGIEVTQKAHSALRWLIKRQGRKEGEQAIVAWAVDEGKSIPDLFADTASLLRMADIEPVTSIAGDSAQMVGIALSKLIAGYSAKLGKTDDVVFIGLDSALKGKGRMAIIYYRELTGSELLERVESWHKECCWLQNFKKDNVFVGAPAPRDIAEVAFGTWRDGKIHVDEKLLKSTVERLLPSIVDGAHVPRDLVESCVRQASNRQRFKWVWDKKDGYTSWGWEKALGIACALYRYQNKDRRYSMALEQDRKTRDYLYGRLLALAERLESRALDAGGEQRETNAGKLMQRFAMRPHSTWLAIETSLAPYKGRLMAKQPGFLWLVQKELDTVFCSFSPDDFLSDQPLNGEFLLGYHCQRAAPLKKEDQEKNDAEDMETND